MNQKKNITLPGMILLNVINFGLVAFWSFDGAAMPLFLTAKFNLSNTAISAIVGIGKFMVFISLIMGLFSDLTRTRWGKRRPLMLAGGLIAAPLVALIPHAPSVWMLIILMTVIYFCVQLAAVPYFALVPEVVPNEKLGTANAWFNVFGGVGTLVAYVVLLTIVFKINKTMAFYVVSMTLLIGTVVSVFSTAEQIPEKPEKINKLKGMAKGIADIFVDLPGLPELSWFMVSNFFFWLGLGAFMVYFTKFMEYYVNYPGTDAGKILGVVVVTSIFLAVPVGLLGDRISRKGMTLAGMISLCVALSIGYFTIGPSSMVSGCNLSNPEGVTTMARQFKYDMSGADLSSFKDEQFSPPADVNKDEMKDKKSDVMRYCLNGTLDNEGCAAAAELVMGKDNAALTGTVEAFKGLKALIRKETAKVVKVAFGVIAFAAVGLTICFVIMATILPTLMPDDKMGLFMGFYSSCTGAGQFLSLLIAGLMIDLTLKIPALGYRWMFVQGSVCMLIASITLTRVPYIPNAKDPTISDLKRRREKDDGRI